MNESDLQRVYDYPLYPGDSKIFSEKGFVIIDNGSQSGTHWTCFLIKLTNPTILTRLQELLIISF